ncbi:MAG: RNA-binding protein [Bacteroidia bacterium]|nr:RNA-binding protein [Bacteroidia bacterium]MDW8159176.1 RNA-binding protein [Bacteroidia bacterium]
MNLFIGNLSYDVSEDDVRDLFEQYGNVVSVTIIRDRETQRARFGFVQMEREDSAREAMRELDGSSFYNRSLRVNEARPKNREQSSRSSYNRNGVGNTSRSSNYNNGRRRGYNNNYD